MTRVYDLYVHVNMDAFHLMTIDTNVIVFLGIK